MKTLAVILSLACTVTLYAQGKFAGNFTSLIGKVYSDQSELPELKAFISRGGAMVTRIDDPEKLTGQWFVKGSTAVVLFERMNENNEREILDVLTLTTKKTQEIKIGECSHGDTEMASLVALVSISKAERVKAIKAWNLNRDKVRIEAFAPENVSCLGMVGDD